MIMSKQRKAAKIHVSTKPTKWFLKFCSTTSPRRKRQMHDKLARQAQKELAHVAGKRAEKLEAKLLTLSPDSDESKILRLDVRGAKDFAADVMKQKLLPRPDETFSMWT